MSRPRALARDSHWRDAEPENPTVAALVFVVIGNAVSGGTAGRRDGTVQFPGLPRVLPAHEVGEAGPVNLNSDRYFDGAGLLLGGQRPEKRVGTEGVVQHVDVNLEDMFIR